MGRAYGIDIKRITLFIFGGVAHLKHEPHAWRAELWMAIAGPITSLVLGILFIVLGNLAIGVEMDPQRPERVFAALGPLPTLLLWLGPVNIILALFNLVPGFPLDGGRVLRAIMWGITGDLRLATRWASIMGQAFAWFLIVVGLVMIFGARVPIFGTGLINGLWLAFIGWFLNNAALISYQQLLVREALEDVPVSRIMQSSVSTIDPGVPVSTLVDEHLMRSDQRAYPVVEGERFVGLVCLEDVRKLARQAWPHTKIREIMTRAAYVAAVAADDDAAEAMLVLTRRRVNQLPVVENGKVQGIVRRESGYRYTVIQRLPASRPDRTSHCPGQALKQNLRKALYG